MKYKKKLGEWGELRAKNYLIEKGYHILSLNFSIRSGEIDIIALKQDYLVFTEVKTRTNTNYGPPQAAVGYRKQEKIKNIAQYYVNLNDYQEYKIRFDVIAITINNQHHNLKHFINAF